MHTGMLKEMMGLYATALSWPDLTTPPILGVLTMDIFVSGIFPVCLLDHLYMSCKCCLCCWYCLPFFMPLHSHAGVNRHVWTKGCNHRRSHLLHVHTIVGADVRAWLQNYLEQVRKLLDGGGWDATSPAGRQLSLLVAQRVSILSMFLSLKLFVGHTTRLAVATIFLKREALKQHCV